MLKNGDNDKKKFLFIHYCYMESSVLSEIYFKNIK